MKLSNEQIKRLENKMAELATVFEENGYDDDMDEIFESIIDMLDEQIDEFN